MEMQIDFRMQFKSYISRIEMFSIVFLVKMTEIDRSPYFQWNSPNDMSRISRTEQRNSPEKSWPRNSLDLRNKLRYIKLPPPNRLHPPE